MPPQITGIYPGVATGGTFLNQSGSMIGGSGISGFGVNGYPGGIGAYGTNGYGMSIINIGYGMGSGFVTQTPGVVTNMNTNGFVT